MDNPIISDIFILIKYNLCFMLKIIQEGDIMKEKFLNFNMKNSFIGLITGFINGVFGSGGGTLLVPIFNSVLKLDEHKSHATALAIILFLTTTSSFVYVSKGTYDLNTTFKVAIGSIIGGMIGAKILSKLTGRFLRISFGFIMIIAALRMVF